MNDFIEKIETMQTHTHTHTKSVVMKKVLKVLHILQVINFGTFYFQPFLLLQLLSKLSLSLSFVCLSFVGILKYYEKFIFQMWMLDLMPCTIINDNLEGTQTWFGGESTTSLYKIDTSWSSIIWWSRLSRLCRW